MKMLLFIAMMFCFLAGNAQQDRHQYGPTSTWGYGQYYTDTNEGYPYKVVVDMYTIRKTDNLGQPYFTDQDRYLIRKTYDLGLPYCKDKDGKSMKKTDVIPGHNIKVDPERYSMKKTN